MSAKGRVSHICGIAGYIVTQPERVHGNALQSLAKNLMLGIEERGKDAAGYAYVSKKDKYVHLAKLPVKASDFLGLEDNLLSRPVKNMPRAMILHTRFATQGSPKNNQNNHPVYSKQSGLCLVHNGWLANDEHLVEHFALAKDAEVDTETYLRLIEKFYLESGDNQVGVERGIQQATHESWGSLACAMVQAGRFGVLWLWRETGPVVLAQVDWGWIFASTATAIMNAVYKSNVHAIDVSWCKMGELSSNTLLRFNADGAVSKYQLDCKDWDKLPETFKHKVTRVWNQGSQGWTYKRNRASDTVREYFGTTYYGGGDYYDDAEISHYNSRGGYAGAMYSKLAGTDSASVASAGARVANGGASQAANSSGTAQVARFPLKAPNGHAIACVCHSCIGALKTEVAHAKVAGH